MKLPVKCYKSFARSYVTRLSAEVRTLCLFTVNLTRILFGCLDLSLGFSHFFIRYFQWIFPYLFHMSELHNRKLKLINILAGNTTFKFKKKLPRSTDEWYLTSEIQFSYYYLSSTSTVSHPIVTKNWQFSVKLSFYNALVD